ncbi:MAG: hypothetical protein R2873_00165 [Caldilineaceae bacterium]
MQRLHADCLPDAVGLAGVILRLGAESPLPAAERYRLNEAVRVFVAQAPAVLDLSVESDQLLLLTAWMLAYEHDPNAVIRRRSRVWSIQAVRPMMSWLRGWPGADKMVLPMCARAWITSCWR